MAHGDRDEVQRLREYVHAELAALNTKCDRLEGELRDVKARLVNAERMAAQALTAIMPPR